MFTCIRSRVVEGIEPLLVSLRLPCLVSPGVDRDSEQPRVGRESRPLKHNEVVPEKVKARFLEPMLLVKTDKLPEGNEWLYELKHDGYRGIAYKTGGKLYLRSRNDNNFSVRYPAIAKALSALPNETVVDGEIVAFDESGKPSFNTLQRNGLMSAEEQANESKHEQ